MPPVLFDETDYNSKGSQLLTEETHTRNTQTDTKQQSGSVHTVRNVLSIYSHHIWKWLEVIYLPRLSLLADSTHFLLCVVFVVSLFEQQVAAEYRVPWCSGRHCIKLFMAMSKIQKGARLTREQQHKSVFAERTAPRNNTYISLHHHNAILRMLVLQKCILHLKVGY